MAEADEAAGLLWLAGASAIEQRTAGPRRVELVAGTPSWSEPALVAAVADRWPTRVVEVEGEGWMDAWRPWARSVRVGRLVVTPPWVEARADAGGDDLVVTIDPGRAFGTGSHPSTVLALEALLERCRAGSAVLDVGCGSGVLSVVAARLGAGRVVGVDVDPGAVTATLDNAGANGVGGQVVASTTPVADLDQAFDLVLANIGAATLVDLAPAVVARVAAGGTLVLSGLLEARVPDLLAAYGELEVEAVPALDGWAAPVLQAPS